MIWKGAFDMGCQLDKSGLVQDCVNHETGLVWQYLGLVNLQLYNVH